MKISLKQLSKVLTSPRVLTPAVFLGVGAGKTYRDYKKEEYPTKKQILIKDFSVLSGASAGCALAAFVFNKFFNYELFSTNKKTLKNIEYILKQSCSSVLTTLLGIGCALFLHEPIEKFLLRKLKNKQQKEQIKKSSAPKFISQTNVFKDFIINTNGSTVKTAEKVFTNMSDLPSMKVFSAPRVALTSFSVVETSGYDNKVKKTTKEIIANTLIPTIFVSTTSIFVNNQKGIIKYPSLLLSLITGTIAGNFVANKTEKQIDNTIDTINTKLLFK